MTYSKIHTYFLYNLYLMHLKEIQHDLNLNLFNGGYSTSMDTLLGEWAEHN